MLVKWGSIIVKGSGKLGGHVYSGGRSGASVHTSARARNPQTIYQTEVRSRFTRFTQGWRDLTESQRDTWYDAEESFSRTNRFGDVVTLSGKNLYESLNTQRAIIGLGALNVAPLPTELLKNTVTQARFAVSNNNLVIEGEFVGNATYVIVASKGLSQGVQFKRDSLRIITVGVSNSAGFRLEFTDEIYKAYVDRFGVPSENDKIFIGSYYVNSSGQKGLVSSILAIYNP